VRLSPRPPLDSIISDEGIAAAREEAGAGADADEGDEGSATYVAKELQGTPVEAFAQHLSDPLRARLVAAGIASLFPVQTVTVRRVLAGENVVVRSRTGSGKTLGFALPVIEMLEREGAEASLRRGRGPRCLVIAPTRELASQITEEFRRFAGRLRICSIYGGVAMGPQFGQLREGVDIVVGTPGRLIDLLQQGALRLDAVKVAVLDEADEMLRMGFKEDVEQIFESTPREKQCMLWSATVPPWVRELAKKFLRSPQFVDMVGDDAAKLPSTVAHHAFVVDGATREEAFVSLLTHYAREGGQGANGAGAPGPAAQARVLVFTETKAEAGRLAMLSVPGGVRMASLTGDLSQVQRERTLADYKAGRLAVICATDVAARGLDINDVEVVIQYRVPRNEEAFTHRAGRTGRAGKKGISIMLISPSEFSLVRRLESSLGFSFSVRPVPVITGHGAVAERDSSRVYAQVLNTPAEAANSVVSSGLYERVVRRVGSPELALRSALALLIAGGNGLAYKSLLTGLRGFVTLVARPGAPAFALLGAAATVLEPPAAPPAAAGAVAAARFRREPAFAAYERAASAALTRLFDEAGVPGPERPRPYAVFVANDGAVVFDLHGMSYASMRAALDAKLRERAEKKAAGTGAGAGAAPSLEGALAVLQELPAEVKGVLAAGRDQMRDFDQAFSRSRTGGGGRGGGGGAGGGWGRGSRGWN